VHLERELWDLQDATGREIGPDAPERRAWLLERGAVGRLRSPVERLLADPGTLAAATRLLLEQHFTPVLTFFNCGSYWRGVRSSLGLARKPSSRPGRYCIRRSRVLTSTVS
jgi:hypothetical protein